MRFASPNPCCGPMVWRVRKTIRSSVPWRMSDRASPVGIQEKFDAPICRMSRGSGPLELLGRPPRLPRRPLHQLRAVLLRDIADLRGVAEEHESQIIGLVLFPD